MPKKKGKSLPKILGRIDALTAEILRLTKEKERETRRAAQAVRDGAKTGDPVLDRLWEWYGRVPDPKIAKCYREAAAAIKGRAGQLAILIEVKESKPIGRDEGCFPSHRQASPSFEVILGRLTDDELVFPGKGALYKCLLPMDRFAEITPWHSSPFTICEKAPHIIGFPEFLGLPLTDTFPDHVFFFQKDLVRLRLIVGDRAVKTWARKFHMGSLAKPCRAAIAQLDRLAKKPTTATAMA